jgi:hypothetical protein
MNQALTREQEIQKLKWDIGVGKCEVKQESDPGLIDMFQKKVDGMKARLVELEKEGSTQ